MAHPTLDAYLAGLPRGIDSFPNVQAKGAIVRAYLEDKQLDASDATVPERLRALIRHPPLAATWVTEVEFLALASLTRDTCFDSDAAFYAWVKQLNKKLFRSPLYRVLFFVATPAMMVGGTSRRWGQFHRGTQLDGVLGTGSAEFTFRFPPGLMMPLHIKLFAAAIEAALECAGARDVMSGEVSSMPGGMKVSCRWRAS